MPGAEDNQVPTLELTPGQAAALKKLFEAGYAPTSVEHVARYLAVEKEGFVALLDPSGGKLSLFGQIGFRVGRGVGVLVERREGKAFVRHGASVPVTPELMASYERIRAELKQLLDDGR